MISLYKGDCLEVMDKLITDGVKVDAVITDPPYSVITGGKNGGKWKPSGILESNKQLMGNIPNFKVRTDLSKMTPEEVKAHRSKLQRERMAKKRALSRFVCNTPQRHNMMYSTFKTD